MGVTKTDLFTKEQNELALIAKAISNPARVAIIQHLLVTKGCINGDLVLELGLAQATVSQHLRELKNVGLIQGTIEGSTINYCINSKRWREIQQMFNSLFDQLEENNTQDCC
ncbi:ArsR/SmtB family transcription factor [Jiulongibacter sp. NS-SX5]|uniref:ArsR/SmtB family transcription factor n=1 Tax=Jiulongibacter sp. NS-SX5 TaxID=3463854 RepID=UPI004058F204